ncbi:MAG: hypothetical protein ACOCY1_00415 [Halovenus sp.]
MRSFADPDTHYELVKSGKGEPTGEVRCLGRLPDGSHCNAVSMNVDDLPHKKRCDQRFVHSEWYVQMLDGRCGGHGLEASI